MTQAMPDDTAGAPNAPDFPIAIGGVGGSGTRMIAQLLIDAGIYMGADLNGANDNLWAVLLFNHRSVPALNASAFAERVSVFSRRMEGWVPAPAEPEARFVQSLSAQPHGQHSSAWLSERCRTFLDASRKGPRTSRWGWKSPPTHMIADRLLETIPGLRYVHVRRSGLDMAFSENRNQLRYWGRMQLGRAVEEAPADALAFWCSVERKIEPLAERYGERVVRVDFDRFCEDPMENARALCRACRVTVDEAVLRTFAAKVKMPTTVGRHCGQSLAGFDAHDLRFARKLAGSEREVVEHGER